MAGFKKVAYLRRVVVNLDDGSSVQGVLFRELRDVLVLKQATYHEPGAEPVDLDGDIIIPRPRVLFAQAP